MAHKDIRIVFQIEDRIYEAVGFMNKGESSVDGRTMFDRTAGENNGAISEGDEAFIAERSFPLPPKLRRYCLVTNRYCTHDPRRVSCFLWYGGRWFQSWGRLGDRWHSSFLVMRRLT